MSFAQNDIVGSFFPWAHTMNSVSPLLFQSLSYWVCNHGVVKFFFLVPGFEGSSSIDGGVVFFPTYFFFFYFAPMNPKGAVGSAEIFISFARGALVLTTFCSRFSLFIAVPWLYLYRSSCFSLGSNVGRHLT